MMNRTRRTLVFGTLITLGVLGTGWALERAATTSRTHEAPASDPMVTPARGAQDGSTGAPTAPNDATQPYDRSDLLLIQG